MNKIERLFLVVMLVIISIAAIRWIGREYFALLAMFDLLVGVIIGMTMFLPNGNSKEYGKDIINDLQIKDGKPEAGASEQFSDDLFELINRHCKGGLKKPELVKTMVWVTRNCEFS